MRKLFFFAALLSLLLMSTPVFAQAATPAAAPATPRQTDEQIKKTVDDILPSTVINDENKNATLPQGDLKTAIVPSAIKMLLGLMGTISFLVLVYAGIQLIISQGNEEELKKFKEMLLWSAVGLILVTTSYGIVRGVMQLIFK